MTSYRPLHEFVAATHSPFRADGALALEVIPIQAAFLAANGVRTVFVSGTTGECHSMTCDERVALSEAWAAAGPAHGLQVIAHVGSHAIEDARRLARTAGTLGLSGISTLAPSYFKPRTLTDLIDWCAAIAAEAPALPFYYYDIPSMTQVSFPIELFLVEAAARIPTLAGVKVSNPDLVVLPARPRRRGRSLRSALGDGRGAPGRARDRCEGRRRLDLQLGASALRRVARRLRPRRSGRSAAPPVAVDRDDRRDCRDGLHGHVEGADGPPGRPGRPGAAAARQPERRRGRCAGGAAGRARFRPVGRSRRFDACGPGP